MKRDDIGATADAAPAAGDRGAKAAARTERMTGARSTIEAVYSSAALANPIVATGEGVYSSRTGRSRLTLAVPSQDFGSMEMEAVGDERAVYIRSEEDVRGVATERYSGHGRRRALRRPAARGRQGRGGQADREDGFADAGGRRRRSLDCRRRHRSQDADRDGDTHSPGRPSWTPPPTASRRKPTPPPANSACLAASATVTPIRTTVPRRPEGPRALSEG